MGGVLIYTHIGGYGFESRCARAIFVVAGLEPKYRFRANIGCEMWLRSRVASPPKGTFRALKRAHMGTPTHVLAR